MSKYLILGAASLAALAFVAPAQASITVPMGTITPATPVAITAGVQYPTTKAFDLRGLFSVAPGTSAVAYANLGSVTRSLGSYSAAIYALGPNSTLGQLVTTVPASMGNSSTYVFESPVAFTLDPGSYVFQVLGNSKKGGALSYTLQVTAVPIPAAALLFGAGLALVGGVAARRRQVHLQGV